MSEYDGRQFVGIDLHRRRSVIVRHDRIGRAARLRADHQRSGWRWRGRSAKPARTRGGARSDLWLVLGGGRAGRGRARGCTWRIRWESRGSRIGGSRTTCATPRTWPICCGWVGCPRRGSPHRRRGSCASWCATAPSWSCCAPGSRPQVHGVLAKAGPARGGHRPVRRPRGRAELAKAPAGPGLSGPGERLPAPDRHPRHRDRAGRRVDRRPAGHRPRLSGHPGHPRDRPGAGRRCSSPRSATSPASPSARHLCSWAGLTPRHRESDTTVHRGAITKMGSTLVRWAAVEAVQRIPTTARSHADKDRIEAAAAEHRHRRRRAQAAHPRLLRPARRAHPRPRPCRGGVSTPYATARGRDVS